LQVPVFGQNPALAAAIPAALKGASQDALPPVSVDETPTLPGTGPAVPVDPTSAKARAPMGFLEMARQAQHHYEENARAATAPRHALFGDDGFDFDDFLDIINPLQHIPIISTIYRAVSGDTIATGPRLAGGALFGGVFGFMSAAVDAAIEDSTGHDIGDHVVVALFGGPEKTEQEPVLFASADPGPSAAAQASAVAASEPVPATSAMPQLNHPLTPAQIEILNAYNDESEQTAAILPANGPAAPAPGPARALSPEQEDLLLQSLGLTPPDADKADATAKVGPETKGEAVAVGDASAQAAPEAKATAQPPGPETLPSTAPANAADPNFALRMKYGLERYFAHPMPHNPDPPQIDQSW